MFAKETNGEGNNKTERRKLQLFYMSIGAKQLTQHFFDIHSMQKRTTLRQIGTFLQPNTIAKLYNTSQYRMCNVCRSSGVKTTPNYTKCFQSNCTPFAISNSSSPYLNRQQQHRCTLIMFKMRSITS